MARFYNAKTDDNHAETLKLLRSLGFSCKSVHQIKGFVDIVAGRNGINYLIEVKDGSKPESSRQLTEKEAEFHNDWKGTLHIIETEQDCYDLLTNHVASLARSDKTSISK